MVVLFYAQMGLYLTWTVVLQFPGSYRKFLPLAVYMADAHKH